MGRNWTRNLPLKIGAVVAAIAGTLGFYGLIQAHPLNGRDANPAAATAPATSPVSEQAPSPVATAVPDSGESQPIEQQPQQTIPRHRISRGS